MGCVVVREVVMLCNKRMFYQRFLVPTTARTICIVLAKEAGEGVRLQVPL